jgi:hypothetical protein
VSANPIVTVLLNGALVVGAQPASLAQGIVVAPLAPYLEDLADRITTDLDGRRITFERGDRRIAVTVDSLEAQNGSIARTLPIAPFFRCGLVEVPLAAVARALGASVVYDAAAHVVRIDAPLAPLATATPAPPGSAPTGPFVTFPPPQTPAPRPTVTGIPQPRRTPIVVGPDG